MNIGKNFADAFTRIYGSKSAQVCWFRLCALCKSFFYFFSRFMTALTVPKYS